MRARHRMAPSKQATSRRSAHPDRVRSERAVDSSFQARAVELRASTGFVGPSAQMVVAFLGNKAKK